MRPELLYSVQSVPGSNKLDTAILYQLKSKWTATEDGRAILFCLFTSETKRLCELVNNDFQATLCGYYHGQMKPEERPSFSEIVDQLFRIQPKSTSPVLLDNHTNSTDYYVVQ